MNWYYKIEQRLTPSHGWKEVQGHKYKSKTQAEKALAKLEKEGDRKSTRLNSSH